VGWYVYDWSSPLVPANKFDWSMTGLLDEMAKGLKAKGWDINKTPLIGIGQAFGDPTHYGVPSGDTMVIQAKAFCHYGASAISWYTWGAEVNSPSFANTSSFADGIQQSIAACRAIWGS
jgi:hypothetical protein